MWESLQKLCRDTQTLSPGDAVCPTEPRTAAGDRRDGGRHSGAVPVSGLVLGKGGSGTAASQGFGCAPPSPGHGHRWLCPHGGPALPPGNVTPAVPWQWRLCSNDKLWSSYAANYPQLCLLICSSSPQRSSSKWLYLYFIFIDLLAMLRGEWTGIQGFK